MYGGTTLASQPHTISAMDTAAAAASNTERGYFRPGTTNTMNRSVTTASARTTTHNNQTISTKSSGVSSTGLIRLTLKKPMGIVFEPMEDPHNPSQQRGVRICDLPRTGSAAMSGQLEIGDELLSINQKTMSRLTFDEIMDFIIEADADSVHLLFRRPKKDLGRLSAVTDSGKKGSNVKWLDGNNDKNVTETIEPDMEAEEDPDQDTIGGDTLSSRSPSPPPKKSSKKVKDEPKRVQRDEESTYSNDETFYTETTEYTEEEKRRNRRRRNKKHESESFLDMLIDSICAPIVGESSKGKLDDYSDDGTYNSGDDETLDTYDDESYVNARKKKWNERRRREKEKQEKNRREKKRNEKKKKSQSGSVNNNNFNENPSSSKSRSKSKSSSLDPTVLEDIDEPTDDPRNNSYHEQAPPPPPPPPPASFGNNDKKFQIQQPADDLNRKDQSRNGMSNNQHMNSLNNINNMNPNVANLNMGNMNIEPKNVFQPNLNPPKNDIGEESFTPDPNIPIAELEYDDRVDADVSVMDSIGGPSLLLENLRNASKIVKTVSPEIIQNYGTNYPQELGLTREESIQIDPNKFYRFVVKNLLEMHEPEKVRLIDKLFEKYRGREEHLIHKLNARYSNDEEKTKDPELKSGTVSTEDNGDYDGFKAFGGDFSTSESTKETAQSKTTFDNSGWPSTIGEEPEDEETNANESHEEEPEDEDDEVQSVDASEDFSESDYESIDGTSPEVIAHVSELLNYVYGKTSVPGQIDRVSTIMRAYEGRTSVLLELLETKALLKANADTEDLDELPKSLRDNPGLKKKNEKLSSKKEIQIKGNMHGQPILSPISNLTGGTETKSEYMKNAAAKLESMPKKERKEDIVSKSENVC